LPCKAPGFPGAFSVAGKEKAPCIFVFALPQGENAGKAALLVKK